LMHQYLTNCIRASPENAILQQYLEKIFSSPASFSQVNPNTSFWKNFVRSRLSNPGDIQVAGVTDRCTPSNITAGHQYLTAAFCINDRTSRSAGNNRSAGWRNRAMNTPATTPARSAVLTANERTGFDETKYTGPRTVRPLQCHAVCAQQGSFTKTGEETLSFTFVAACCLNYIPRLDLVVVFMPSISAPHDKQHMNLSTIVAVPRRKLLPFSLLRHVIVGSCSLLDRAFVSLLIGAAREALLTYRLVLKLSSLEVSNGAGVARNLFLKFQQYMHLSEGAGTASRHDGASLTPSRRPYPKQCHSYTHISTDLAGCLVRGMVVVYYTYTCPMAGPGPADALAAAEDPVTQLGVILQKPEHHDSGRNKNFRFFTVNLQPFELAFSSALPSPAPSSRAAEALPRSAAAPPPSMISVRHYEILDVVRVKASSESTVSVFMNVLDDDDDAAALASSSDGASVLQYRTIMNRDVYSEVPDDVTNITTTVDLRRTKAMNKAAMPPAAVVVSHGPKVMPLKIGHGHHDEQLLYDGSDNPKNDDDDAGNRLFAVPVPSENGSGSSRTQRRSPSRSSFYLGNTIQNAPGAAAAVDRRQEQQQFRQNQNVCNCNEPHAEEQQQRQGSQGNAPNSKHLETAQDEDEELLGQDVEKWKQDVKMLKQAYKKTKQDVEKLKQDTETSKQANKQMKQDVEKLKQDVEKLKQNVERLKNNVKEVGTEDCHKDRLVCPPKASADAANHANALDEGLESGQRRGREKEDDYEDEDDVPSVDKKPHD